jgi:hypothetical protein
MFVTEPPAARVAAGDLVVVPVGFGVGAVLASMIAGGGRPTWW